MIVGRTDRTDRLAYINNVDYLSKSRLEAEADREKHSRERGRTDRDAAVPQSDGMPFADADKELSIINYLMYIGPTGRGHEFVNDALFSGRASGLLTSTYRAKQFFRNEEEFRNEHGTFPRDVTDTAGVYRQPTEVSLAEADTWRREIELQKKDIRGRLLAAKVRSDDQSSGPGHSNKRPRLSYEIVENRVDVVVDRVIREVDLNEEQSLALRLFVAPLKAVVETDEPSTSENRCMYLGGAGGTGKSKVIHCVKIVFHELGCTDLLVSATTGVAAQLIGGSTIDSLCKFSRKRKHDDDDRYDAQDVSNYWLNCRFLILDEASMLGCAKLFKISEALSKLKGNDLPFGGLHVLFCGDFQQLKPVKDIPLFIKPKHADEKSPASKGYELWEKVTETTVILHRNYRARDPVLSGLLLRLAKGQLTSADKEILKSRVIGKSHNIDMRQWRNAVLLTPRNSIRQRWNGNAAVSHFMATGNQIFISPSRDEGVTCSRVNMLWTGDNHTDYLPTWNVLAINAPALVTANMAVELQIANGTDVIIKEVVPHPNDIDGWDNCTRPIVRLSQPPLCVFVEPIAKEPYDPPYHPEHPTWFPLFPVHNEIPTPRSFGAVEEEKKFTRTQIPLLLAFAICDYRVQGKTLNRKFIIDLHKPPTGKLDIQNIYVMLSRAVSLDDVLILRDYDDKVLDTTAEIPFLEYEQVLEERAKETAVRFMEQLHSLSV